MNISLVRRFVCIAYNCHCSACLFVDSEGETSLRAAWVIQGWWKSSRHSQSSRKPVKRCAKQLFDYPGTAFWLPFFSVIIKKSCSLSSLLRFYQLWHNHSALRKHLIMHFLGLEVAFPSRERLEENWRWTKKREKTSRCVDVHAGWLLVTEVTR